MDSVDHVVATDYGLPCVPAFTAFSVPFYIAYVLHVEVGARLPSRSLHCSPHAAPHVWAPPVQFGVPVRGGTACALVWAMLVCISSLYLGSHTLVDVAAGAVFGLLAVTAWIALDAVLAQLLARPHALVLAALVRGCPAVPKPR